LAGQYDPEFGDQLVIDTDIGDSSACQNDSRGLSP
jgi:hypothetical protein